MRTPSAIDSRLILLACRRPEQYREWCQDLRRLYPIQDVTEQTCLVRTVQCHKPIVLLLENESFRPLDLSTIAGIRKVSPLTKIVIIANGIPDHAVLLLEAGVAGFLPPTATPGLVRKAIERLQDGEIWVPRDVACRVLDRLLALKSWQGSLGTAMREQALAALTPREQEIAELVGEGSSNKEIAHRLVIADRTVKAHLSSIFRKLDLPDRLHLAIFMAQVKGSRDSIPPIRTPVGLQPSVIPD